MWFKHIQIFNLDPEWTLDLEALQKTLGENAFEPCKAIEAYRHGWVSPLGGDSEGELIVEQDQAYLLCLKSEEKIMPQAVIKSQLDERVVEIEMRESRRLSKQEKDNLKEEIYFSMLARAFSKTTSLYAYFDLANRWLIVNTASAKKAEFFTEFLRKSVGTLPISRPDFSPVSKLLTSWVQTSDYPSDFVIEENCVLKDEEKKGGVIRCQKQDLLSEEIVTLIEEGRKVTQMSLSWRDQLRFNLKEDGTITSLAFLEVIQDQANDAYTESATDRFQADYVIMVGALRVFLKEFIALFVVADETTSEASSQSIA